MADKIDTIIERIILGGYDAREAYGMVETLRDVQKENSELERENARLREALRISVTYGLPPDDVSGRAEWIRARAALEGK